MQALVDTGASVSIIKKRNICPSQIFQGRPICVRGYDGHTKQHSDWVVVTIQFQSNTIEVHALVIDGIEYDFLLSP